MNLEHVEEDILARARARAAISSLGDVELATICKLLNVETQPRYKTKSRKDTTMRYTIKGVEDIATIEIITTFDKANNDMERVRNLLPLLDTETEVLGPTWRGDYRRITLQVHKHARDWCTARIQGIGLDVVAQ